MSNNFAFSVEDLVERYGGHFNEFSRPVRYFKGKSVEYILNECRGIYNTLTMLSKEEMRDLCIRAKMNPDTLILMARVGTQAKRLLAYKDKMPARYTLISEVANMDDSQINRAISQGVLHPTASTNALRIFQGKRVKGMEQKPDEVPEWKIIKKAS